MPRFETSADADEYFAVGDDGGSNGGAFIDEQNEAQLQKRARILKERFASLLTVAHRRLVLSRRCMRTMQKLVGVERERERHIDAVRQHYAALSARSKHQFLKRFRTKNYNETTLAIRGVARAAENLQAPLPVPGFDDEDDDDDDGDDDNEAAETMEETKAKDAKLAKRQFSALSGFVQHEILSPPKRQKPTIEERGATRGGRGGGARGGGGRGRRARRGGRC